MTRAHVDVIDSDDLASARRIVETTTILAEPGGR